MGLAIAKGIVEAHGGKIWVAENEKGCEICFYRADQTEMNESKKILVVDDESQITRVLRGSLTAHKYLVRTAADGISALDTFHDWKPDLIISDLQMPEMDGIELCREIRKISQTPIIVLSVKGEEKTKIEALDAGADDYITKPFSIDELMARIRANLRRLPSEKTEIEPKSKPEIF